MEQGSGLDDDVDFLAPAETTGQGDLDGPRRGPWLRVAGGVALVALTAWALGSGAGHRSVPAPVPTPTAPSATASPPPPVTPQLEASSLYVRGDVADGRAVVVIPLVNFDLAPVTLTGVDVAGGVVPVTGQLMTLDRAAPLILAPPATHVPAPSPTAETPIPLLQGASAALVLTVTPDCRTAAAAEVPEVTVRGTSTIAGTAWPAIYHLRPSAPDSSTTWQADAVAAVCDTNAGPQTPLTSVTRLVDGLQVTTAGPTHPPARGMFAVALIATNTTSNPFRGALGVGLAGRATSTGTSGMTMVDPLDRRPNLTEWSSTGSAVDGIRNVMTGQLLTGQRIAAHASLTLTFFLDDSGLRLLGPSRGWVPAVRRDGTASPVTPDASRYPVITLAR